MTALLLSTILAADSVVPRLLFGIIVGGAVGAAIGNAKNRLALGLILGAVLGCIGWIIIAVIPKKDPGA